MAVEYNGREEKTTYLPIIPGLFRDFSQDFSGRPGPGTASPSSLYAAQERYRLVALEHNVP